MDVIKCDSNRLIHSDVLEKKLLNYFTKDDESGVVHSNEFVMNTLAQSKENISKVKNELKKMESDYHRYFLDVTSDKMDTMKNQLNGLYIRVIDKKMIKLKHKLIQVQQNLVKIKNNIKSFTNLTKPEKCELISTTRGLEKKLRKEMNRIKTLSLIIVNGQRVVSRPAIEKTGIGTYHSNNVHNREYNDYGKTKAIPPQNAIQSPTGNLRNQKENNYSNQNNSNKNSNASKPPKGKPPPPRMPPPKGRPLLKGPPPKGPPPSMGKLPPGKPEREKSHKDKKHKAKEKSKSGKSASEINKSGMNKKSNLPPMETQSNIGKLNYTSNAFYEEQLQIIKEKRDQQEKNQKLLLDIEGEIRRLKETVTTNYNDDRTTIRKLASNLESVREQLDQISMVSLWRTKQFGCEIKDLVTSYKVNEMAVSDLLNQNNHHKEIAKNKMTTLRSEMLKYGENLHNQIKILKSDDERYQEILQVLTAEISKSSNAITDLKLCISKTQNDINTIEFGLNEQTKSTLTLNNLQQCLPKEFQQIENDLALMRGEFVNLVRNISERHRAVQDSYSHKIPCISDIHHTCNLHNSETCSRDGQINVNCCQQDFMPQHQNVYQSIDHLRTMMNEELREYKKTSFDFQAHLIQQTEMIENLSKV